jgi:hypothetical protein
MTVLAIAMLMVDRCANPIVDQIVVKNRGHFESAVSFESNAIHYFNTNLDEPTTSNRMLIESPPNIVFLTHEGTSRIISIGNTVYRRTEWESEKCSCTFTEDISNANANANANQRNLLFGFLPPTLFDTGIVQSESDDDVYAIEGFGVGFDHLGLLAKWGNWHRLKTLKSDFDPMSRPSSIFRL